MRRLLLGTALAAFMCAGATTRPAIAAGTVHAVSSVELTADPGFEGSYKYTIEVEWDLEENAVGHLTFFLRLDALADTCESGDVLFPTPAGTSTGESGGDPCQLEYEGQFLCKTDPSLGLEDPNLSVKFNPIEVACETTTEGSGTFIFYTHVAPDIPGSHAEAVAIKHGESVTIGTIDGALPGTPGLRERGIALINEFLVKPKPGDNELIELVSTKEEEIDLTGWYLEIDGELKIPLDGTLNPNEFQVISTPVPPNTVVVDFDQDPFGAPIACGTPVNFAYTTQGLTMTGLPATLGGGTCSESADVYANCNLGEGSVPNVISVCSGEGGVAFSEFLDGTVRVDLCTPASRVCIDVFPDDPTAFGFIRAEASGDTVQGEIQSTPGMTQTICFEFPGMTTFFFAGFAEHRAAFDNLTITFEDEPGCPILLKSGGLAYGTAEAEEEELNFVQDEGGSIVLFDNFDLVQDQVAYGNQGGAPISAPLVLPPGYPLPPIFQKGAPFGTESVEPDTFSTSTQRVSDSQDTDVDANDFNIGNPSPFADNEGSVAPRTSTPEGGRDGVVTPSSVEAPALGSSIRINAVYAFATGGDGIEFYNPTGELVDMAGWFLSDGSIVEPIFDGGGSQPVPSGDRTAMPQGFPSTFSFELAYEDVLYLYSPDLVRLDQMGWTQTPFFFPDLCLLRTPDGAGPADGYNFNTSGGFTGNLLYDSCPLQSLTVDVESGSFTTALASPFPNPASSGGSGGTISFVVGGSAGNSSQVSLAVYDVAGRKLRTLAQGPFPAGAYSVAWDGRSDGGAAVGTGVYFVRLRVAGEPIQTRSVVWAQ